MPPITTTPLGTLIRPSLEWRLDDLALGSFGSNATSATLFQYISLFNNDPRGRSFVIWNSLTSVDSFNFFFLFMFSGNRGNKVGSCVNVNPLGAAPPGQMYFDTPATAYTDTPVVTVGTLVGQPFPQNTPSLVIPAGWSLAFGSNLKGADTSLALWYLPTA